MLTSYFIKGWAFGLYLALPFGAVSLIYITKTLKFGKLLGIVSALGVTTAEAIYGAIAIFGISQISDLIISWKSYLKICGAILLLLIGLRSIFNKTKIDKITINNNSTLFKEYCSMLVIGILNPMAIVGFIALLSSFGIQEQFELIPSIVMLIGFTTASFSYCVFLIFLALFLRSKFDFSDKELFDVLSKISGIVIIFFTLAILAYSFS